MFCLSLTLILIFVAINDLYIIALFRVNFLIDGLGKTRVLVLRLRSDISAICHLVQYIWHFPHKHTKIYFALNCVNRNKWHFIQYFLYCPNSAKSEGSIPSMANSDASGSSDFCLVSAIVCWYTGWAVVG